MKEKTTRRRSSSRVAWESLEKWARLEIQDWVQELMVAEVTELLGREKSERRKPVDTTAGYRNGYGKPRKLTMSVGTVTVRRPRVRDVEESGCVPRFVEKERRPPLRHQSIISGGNLRVFENLAQTLVAVDAS